MVKIVFLFLYIMGGEVRLEQKPMPDMDTCVEKGQARIAEVLNDPKLDAPLYADCLPLLVTEAQNTKKS
jgi:hypothetical protein